MDAFPFDDDSSAHARRLLVSACEIFGRPVLSEDSARIYFAAIGCADTRIVTEALRNALRLGREFPVPAAVRLWIEQPPEAGGRDAA